ncbi:MAG TPA: hypothetical protein VM935_00335, partial [Chitinophagaceae bacterium]|nr:hypothetical protein [Chitinophagaceae bacterium]
MRPLIVFISAILLITSCNNKGSDRTAATFCDTTCTTDTFNFEGDHKFKPYVNISVKNCTGDTITWNHGALPAGRQMHLGTLLGNLVRLNSSAINCYIKDTSYAWVSFNDCMTGRGYLMHLPFNKKETVRKMSSAINSFDKKFVVPEDLRAYCDYSTIYVEDINTGAKAQMTFKEEYKIDFNTIHETIDTVNISRNRIFVQLIKDGNKIPIE